MHEQEYLGIKDISAIMGICYQKAAALVKYSGLKYNKIGNIYLVHRNELYNFLEENQRINLKEAAYHACIRTHKKKNH